MAVHGRGRDRYTELIDAGARWHETPRSLAADATVVLLMLPDLPQVEDVLAGDDGLLADSPDDLLVVVSSTSSPTGVRRLGERLVRESDGRVRVVDAPVPAGQMEPRPGRCRSWSAGRIPTPAGRCPCSRRAGGRTISDPWGPARSPRRATS